MPLNPADQYHLGIVVEDFDAARRELTQTLGYEWGADVQLEYTMEIPGGPVTFAHRLQYSVTEPRLELVLAQPNTPFQPSTSGLHHTGYWCDDVVTTTAELQATGWAWECGGNDDDGTPMWAYLTHPNGVRVELVSTVMRSMVEDMWAPQ